VAKRKPPQSKPAEGSPTRDAKGRLLPGHSGNPGGVPKWVREVRAELEEGSKDAADLLRRVVKDEDAFLGVRVMAAKVILEFSLPKPKVEVKVDAPPSPLAGLSPEQLLAVVKAQVKG
jgi:hypothetical protein